MKTAKVEPALAEPVAAALLAYGISSQNIGRPGDAWPADVITFVT
ncbi:hypothetical protein [Actinomadura formosensis]|nr:hypothetical protein [Actinomadura formosensis]